MAAVNCKPGDLAIYVNSNLNLGRVVRCIRLATEEELDEALFWNCGPVWVTDVANKTTDGAWLRLASDHRLRPLRDDEGDDETLSWASVPNVDAAERRQKQTAE